MIWTTILSTQRCILQRGYMLIQKIAYSPLAFWLRTTINITLPDSSVSHMDWEFFTISFPTQGFYNSHHLCEMESGHTNLLGYPLEDLQSAVKKGSTYFSQTCNILIYRQVTSKLKTYAQHSDNQQLLFFFYFVFKSRQVKLMPISMQVSNIIYFLGEP